jgi:hypothetical protein
MPEKKTAYLRVSREFFTTEPTPFPEGTELLKLETPPTAYRGELWLLIAHPDLPDDWKPGDMMLVTAVFERDTARMVRFAGWRKATA